VAFFTMRFDLRNPAFAGVSVSERYAAALDMAQWGDEHGFVAIILSEHHGSEDGYLPGALPFAAAVAARTKQARIMIAALVAAFHHPVKMAEDVAVIDAISGGRLDVVVTNGYVQSEFDMFDVPRKTRVGRTVQALRALQAFGKDEPFEYAGRQVRITPGPASAAGPGVMLGGSSVPAARRAAELGVGILPSSAEIWDAYRQGCLDFGRPDPGGFLGGDTSFIHVATDVERAWEQIGPHAMHEANAYAAWMGESGIGAEGGYVPFASIEELRASGQYRVLTPEELTAELKAAGDFASCTMHPMMGGIPPAVAWESLELVAREVMPALA
jgi:alkanesulfonate monooxygenase SsuD/methylene tetrahydromethanopterin reductase-like flavin-dependent oxidoreductase (luciferase family)